MHPADKFAERVGEPCFYTFTSAFPFPLGIPDETGHTIQFEDPFADPDDQETYGPSPTVDIRVFTIEEDGLPMWPEGIDAALKHFFDHDFETDPDQRHSQGELSEHRQWISLETPAAPTVSEMDVADPGFAFHRCLRALSLFLRSVQIATRDISIRPISTHDLRPAVIIGARSLNGDWQELGPMFMHPDARPAGLPPTGGPLSEERLRAAMDAVQTNQAYLTAALWRARAERAARQVGDAADAIISFQVAAESMLFDTYRMIMVDEGLSSAEIDARLDGEVPFKSLVTKTMPERLGGRWDVTATGTAVGGYWERLYEVRNTIIHAGYEPSGVEAEAAREAFRDLRDHLEDRLKAKRTTYPRTVLVRLGEDGLRRHGLMSRKMKQFLVAIADEPGPWHWPYDLSGRENRPGLG